MDSAQTQKSKNTIFFLFIADIILSSAKTYRNVYEIISGKETKIIVAGFAGS
jgi:hypothetical protein